MTRDICSYCGAAIRRGALSCPECGSDPETGWANDTAQHDAAFSPFTDEDYDDVVAGLPGHDGPGERTARDWVLIAVAALTLAAFLVATVI